jgi:hypothetical protein
MPSGGRRQGTPGRNYPNRRDMRTKQAPKAAQGQPYGEAGQQLAAQKQIPLSRTPAPSPQPGGTAALAGMVGGGAQSVPPLNAPSTRPNEPLTAGLATGPGPGPEALNLPAQVSEDDQMLAVLRAFHQAYPNTDIARLISEVTTRGTAVQ